MTTKRTAVISQARNHPRRQSERTRHRDKQRAELRTISFARRERLDRIGTDDEVPFEVLVGPVGEYGRHNPPVAIAAVNQARLIDDFFLSESNSGVALR